MHFRFATFIQTPPLPRPCDYAPVLYSDDAVGELRYLFVVRDHDHRLGELLSGHLHKPKYVLARSGIEISGRLVGKQYRGLSGKRAGDRVEYGGLFGHAYCMDVNRFGCEAFIARGGRIPAPIHSLRN